MNFIILGRHKRDYKMQIINYAKRLGATDVTLWSDGSVDMECPDGNICRRYKPTPAELKPRESTLSVFEMAAFYGEYGIQ